MMKTKDKLEDQSEAFSAIIEETEKLIAEDIPESFAEKLRLIHAIARYQSDVRGVDEK